MNENRYFAPRRENEWQNFLHRRKIKNKKFTDEKMHLGNYDKRGIH